MRWVLVALIGFFTGFTAFLIDMGIYGLRYLKYKTIFFGYCKLLLATLILFHHQLSSVYPLLKTDGTIFLALLVLVGLNVAFALVAAILVAIEVCACRSIITMGILFSCWCKLIHFLWLYTAYCSWKWYS